MSNRVCCAIDLSGAEAGVAIRFDDQTVVDFAPMHGRDSAHLTNFINECLHRHGFSLTDVKDWTVGAGPGSFTGLRLAAALVQGVVYGRDDICTRTVPGSIALAANLKDAANVSRIACLYDGRNREIIVSEVVVHNGQPQTTGHETILNLDTAAPFLADARWDALVSLKVEHEAICNIAGAAAASQIKAFDHLQLAALIDCRYRPYNNDLTDLVYVRPAVFV